MMWGTKGCEKYDSSSYSSLSCTTLLVFDSLSESSSLVPNKKSSYSSENMSLSSYLSKTLEISSSIFLLDAAIFIALDRWVYSVSNKCHGGHWLQRRRQMVVPHRRKTVDYLTVFITNSYHVIYRRYQWWKIKDIVLCHTHSNSTIQLHTYTSYPVK